MQEDLIIAASLLAQSLLFSGYGFATRSDYSVIDEWRARFWPLFWAGTSCISSPLRPRQPGRAEKCISGNQIRGTVSKLGPDGQ